MDSLDGLVERITFYNEENGYTVLRLSVRGYPELVTVVGNLPEITPGESLRLQGQWLTNAQYGKQFKAEKCEQILPATIEGIKKYLGSGLIKGVGPVTASRIVKKFGTETLDVLDHSPERIREVLGIGSKRTVAIAQAWDEQKAIKQVMLFLQSHGVSTSLAVKIYKQYGDTSIDQVQADPYRLAHDIYGIGFKTADKIAHDLGLPHDAPSRVAAGVVYTLSNFTDQGHVFAPQSQLIHDASELLEVQPDQVTTSLDTLIQSDQIRRDIIYPTREERERATDPASSLSPARALAASEAGRLAPPSSLKEEPAIYLTPFYQGEVSVAKRLNAIIDSKLSCLSELQHVDLQAALNELSAVVSNRPTARLSDQQQQAVRTALKSKVTVLTGGPGTGKTTAMRAVIDLLEKYNRRYALTSPTGRAAKRLSQATDRSAKTIHRLLEFAPGEGFKRNAQNPLEIDLLIVDEASMIDLLLMNHLLKAVPLDAHLLLVGDVDQLPSVGAGDVLRDVIDSGRAAVIRLDVIFRQAMNSHIITNSHRINRGQMPLTPKEADDFFFFVKEDPDEAAELIVDLVAARIPNKFGVKPVDIQVLSPMYRSSTGVMVALHVPLHTAPDSTVRRTRVLVVDDHEMVRQGLRLLLAQSSDFVCVAEAADGHAALRQAEQHEPKLVIMDVSLPDGNGIETARQLMKRVPRPLVIIYTYHDDETYLEQALLAGAQGYVLKSDPNQLILTALRAVHAGEMFISPAVADKWEQLQTRPTISHPLDSLSSRERQVLQLIASGHANQRVATTLGISIRTVEVHRRNIMDKVGVKNAAQLIKFSVEHSLI